MEALAEHTIVITGLKDGLHSFDMELGDSFFAASGMEEFLGGRTMAHLDLEKTNHLYVASIQVDGHVTMLCDRCNSRMEQPVHGSQRQIFQLNGDGESDDDELVNLDPATTEINFTHYLFECISLNLPIRHVHPAGQCDPEVTRVLEKLQVHHEPDPRWSALQKLKKPGA